MGKTSIITADIIGSERLQKRNQDVSGLLVSLFEKLGEELQDYIHPVDSPADNAGTSQHRGDGLQLMCKVPEQGILVMMLIKAWMVWRSPELVGQAVGIRLSLGIGEGSLQSTLGSSGGSAFVLSGRGLDALKAPYTMSIALDMDSNDLRQQSLQQVVTLLDNLSGRWKPAQGRTMFYLLQGYNYTWIAQTSAISKKVTGTSGKSAGWPWLEKTMPFCEQLIKQSL